ncbi:hypothetical protein KSP39_PZI005983 [Platanthera zijinensis]|uniref:BRCT domain-containing protein n=1 Tax=Platanthera zijinensis TaxID=2320716 RepID=A0AAP0BRI2_9ASPA
MKSDSWLKKAGYDPRNGVQSVGSIINGIKKFSFEKEFPSLVAEEKHVGMELPSVSSPGLNSTIHSLPGTASTIIGTDVYTFVLARVPSIIGETSFDVSSVVKSSHALAPNVLSTSTGLNIAKTVAQPLVRSCAAPSVILDLWNMVEPVKTIFTACEKDMEEALLAAKMGVRTFTSDWLMNCVMTQELDLVAHQFAESL